MAIWDAFRLAGRISAPDFGTPYNSSVKSPWSETQLAKVAWSDIFGAEYLPVTRAEALRVPAVAKGRALIAGTLGRQPLAKFRHDVRIDADPWMYRTNTAVPPIVRMIWTFDDLVFSGNSLWTVQRGTRGQIIDAARVPREWWRVDPDSLGILVNEKPASAEEVIYFEGPQEGLLEVASDDIRAARSMTRSWANRVDTPIPTMELHITDPNLEPEDGELTELIDSWEVARRKGGTAITPSYIETKTHGDVKTDLYVEGRNASRLDFANHLNLPSSLLEGSQATATLTYSTNEGRRAEFVDYSLSYWAAPVEARLSMDDVVPAGTRTAFDLHWLTTQEPQPSAPPTED